MHASGVDRGTVDRCCIAAGSKDPRGRTGCDSRVLRLDVPDAVIDRNTRCRHRRTAADNAFVVAPESSADYPTHRHSDSGIIVDEPWIRQRYFDVVAVVPANHPSPSSGGRNSHPNREIDRDCSA